jgi:hypothetical protein
MRQLLNSLAGFHFFEDEGIEDGKHVPAVGEDSVDAHLGPGLTPRQALPAFHDLGWDIDILAEFLERMTAQKEAVKKRSLVLRLGERSVNSRGHFIHPSNSQIVWRRCKVNSAGASENERHILNPLSSLSASVHAGLVKLAPCNIDAIPRLAFRLHGAARIANQGPRA